MTNATFHNFSSTPFTGYWNGKPKTFKPGEKVYMPAYLAEHFAKHLTNRHLIENKMDVYTSPKNPGQVPQFMDVFKKAFIPDAPNTGNEVDDGIAKVSEPSMDIVVEKPIRIDQGPAAALAEQTGPGSEPQIKREPEGDDESFDLPANQ